MERTEKMKFAQKADIHQLHELMLQSVENGRFDIIVSINPTHTTITIFKRENGEIAWDDDQFQMESFTLWYNEGNRKDNAATMRHIVWTINEWSK